MNFSKLKLNEGIAMSGGTQSSFDAANTARENSGSSSTNRFDRKKTISTGKTRGSAQPTSPIQSGNTVMDSVDHLKQIQSEKESLRLYERQKSDWKKELQEKAVDGVEKEQHPFVTVMPTGDENLIQAMKQLKGEVGEKKSQLAKGKEGEEVKEEFISEDEKTELQKKASRGDRFAMGKLKELRASGKIGKEDKATWGPGAKKDIPNMKKIMGIGEETELSEKKKECKDGYERDDDGKCVKKSKKTTTIIGRGYGYGHHHNDDGEDNGEDNGSSGNGGGDGGGGGVGEMFDFLGDLLLQEKTNSK